MCECPTNCFQEPLGSLVSPGKRQNADTRVFVLKTADGSPFHAFINNKDCGLVCPSSLEWKIFLTIAALHCASFVQSQKNQGTMKTLDMVQNCCIDLSSFCHLCGFESTNDCITVDLSCFCAIQCIADVDLGICQ